MSILTESRATTIPAGTWAVDPVWSSLEFEVKKLGLVTIKGRVPGFEKAAWTDILPEYAPYKYNSFTANIGDQVYQLTQRIAEQLGALASEGVVRGFPPILAFQSVADATVSTPAVVDALFGLEEVRRRVARPPGPPPPPARAPAGAPSAP